MKLQIYVQPGATLTIEPGTVIGQPAGASAGDHGAAFRDNARVQYRNCIFMELGERVIANDNVDGGDGYGASGTLTFNQTWDTRPQGFTQRSMPCRPCRLRKAERFRHMDGINLLYVGRISREKNLGILSCVYKGLLQTNPTIHLILVGEGPYMDEMKAELAGTPAFFTGRLEGDDLCAARGRFTKKIPKRALGIQTLNPHLWLMRLLSELKDYSC